MAITTSFDLYGLFVENLFGGSIFFTIVGLMIGMAGILMFGRSSLILTSYVLLMFFLIMMVGFFGSFVGILVFAFSFIYFAASLIPFIRGFTE